MTYKIFPYSFGQAKKINVIIKPSSNILKKIDVFKNGKKVASIGANGMKDYPTFLDLEKRGLLEKGYAKKRRELYKTRHQEDRKIIGSAGWYADKILW